MSNPFDDSNRAEDPFLNPPQQSYNPSFQQPYQPYAANYSNDSIPRYNQENYNVEDFNNNSPLPPNLKEEKPKHADNFEDSFVVAKPKWNDLPFIFLFVTVLIAFFAVFGVALKNAISYNTDSDASTDTFHFNGSVVGLIFVIVVIASVLSFLGLVIARVSAKGFIIAGLVFNIATTLLACIVCFVKKTVVGGIVLLILALLHCLMFYLWRKRIPFSAQVLEIVIDVMRIYPVTWTISLIGGLISLVFSLLTLVAVVGAVVEWGPDQDSSSDDGDFKNKGAFIGVCIFLLFASGYISQVIGNVIHVTISGIYGTWYYLSGSGPKPKNAASGALKRAMTYSFGSICFGSLVVALVEFLHALASAGKHSARQDGNIGLFIAFCILECISGLFGDIIKWFNRYAYSYIALYGKSFMTSARETFELLRVKGLDALIQDCLIGKALSMYTVFVGYLSALVCLGYLAGTNPVWAQNSEGNFSVSNGYVIGSIIVALVIGLLIASTVCSVIYSGTTTFFVALAKDPEVFQYQNPERFRKIFETYPQVLEKVLTTRS
ncbi:hypothetical protein CANARDRAFT_26803 [[Candida] arabinofermentans NRRL YB-2248]|uniref:Protein PNS1 n=1 Tax=[Candida] arabinofermentans NRRL YB-2248 TaxID=983967 RepID=A0A1E4T6M1_9ASCO|nr:hypothetical protein CANARDRAFT_26803 [[Candida] arabinofermentans NRRL YB-2248]